MPFAVWVTDLYLLDIVEAGLERVYEFRVEMRALAFLHHLHDPVVIPCLFV
jgi:hypothetical protein